MYLTLLFLPFLGCLVLGFFGRKLGTTGSQFISCSCLMISCLLSLIVFYEVAFSCSSVLITISPWIDSELLSVSWCFLFDSLTVSMLLAVLIVSSLVHLFSVDYMSGDPHQTRFFFYLSLFTFFMLILVTGNNFLVLFVGWEGIGIASYLLINFWYTRIQANKSAMKALIVNRVGDYFLSLGFFSVFFTFASTDFATVFSTSALVNETSLIIIGYLFLGGAAGKSALLGLHVWLPDAMEGPTPVSALIHAATLVTAGVYLLLRSSPLLEYAPTVLLGVTFLGSLTAFVAASTGLLQNDLKRIIAFSTMSQIGYMFIAVGLSQYNVALFHLVNHAFFKSLLFLSAGSVLHAMADEQDIRKLGGLLVYLPFTYTAILIGSLSLMALPFLTGFYSKDLILELAYSQYQFSGTFAYWAGTISACFTAYYSFRLISYTFLSRPNGKKFDYLNSHEASIIVSIPLIILSLFSIGFGFLAKDLYVGVGSDFLSSSLFTHPLNIHMIEAEFALPFSAKFLPSCLTIFGALAAYLLLNIKIFSSSIDVLNYKNKTILKAIYSFLNGKWLFDNIYNYYVTYKALEVGYQANKVLDRGIIEMVGPQGLSLSIYSTANKGAKLDTGLITDYALYILIALIIFLAGLVFIPVSLFT